MPILAQVTFHPSQFPDQVRRDLADSLRLRQLNHKFLYESLKQTQKWLAVHQAYSPSRSDPDCAAIYDQSFAELAHRLETPVAQLVGLGAGGGQKDRRLLRCLQQEGREISYLPVDVGSAMVLIAREAALEAIPANHCAPLVCDLATATDLDTTLEQMAKAIVERGGVRGGSSAVRVVTFFGMLPNFEPEVILPRLKALIRPGDWLLMSANLAPGNNYEEGVRKVLPLYDNAPTREWLLSFLLDLGVERNDGELRILVEDGSTESQLKRLAAYFVFRRPHTVQLDDERFDFYPNESIRLFFSYRHTPARLRDQLFQYGLTVQEEWITRSEEESVFLVSRVS